MRNPHGYGIATDRFSGKTVAEFDYAQCRHCQAHIAVKPGTASTTYLIPDMAHPSGYREEAGAWCTNCFGPICLRCHDKGVCIPFMRKIDAAEARQRQVNKIVLGVA